MVRAVVQIAWFYVGLRQAFLAYPGVPFPIVVVLVERCCRLQLWRVVVTTVLHVLRRLQRVDRDAEC